MTRALGSLDFFVLEATDCLGRIEQLIAAFETPPAEDLLRAARALRGAAVLAQRVEIAETAAGFEAVGRALRSGLVWDASRRQRTHQAVESFRLVVRAATHWSDADAERARSVGRILAAVAGQESAATPAPAAPAEGVLAAGVRAFIAREGALVASALAEAAQLLRERPDRRDALQPVARRLMALRGLGEVRELSPLPELLDAVELLADDLPRIGAPSPQLSRIAEAAAAALARICREIAGDGRPSPDAPDARQVVAQVFDAAAVERDVVPIATLLAAGATMPVAQDDDGRPPMGALALVSLGEHLTQAADVLARAPRLMQRELRGYAAIVMLRRTAAIGGAPTAGLRDLLRGMRAALGSGLLREDAPRIAAALREAAGLLRQVSDATDRRTLARQLTQLGQRLADAGRAAGAGSTPAVEAPAAPVVATPMVPVVETPVVSVLELIDDAASPIVPIEQLLMDEPPMAVAAAEVTAEADVFVDSWLAYEAMLAAAAPEETAPLVPIETLLYRGDAAQQRARELAGEVQERLRRLDALVALQPLMDELCDLLELADEPR